MKINYQGHSAVYIETRSGHKLLIDPFLTGNKLSTLSPDDVEVDYILLTHGHDDHVGDTVAIARRTGAQVIAPVELANYLGTQEVDAMGMNVGGRKSFEFGTVKFVQAFHSSSLTIDDKNYYMGPACGIIIKTDNVNIYHVGDTALFSDLKLIGELNPIDLALIPIGDFFTMGPDEAAIAADYIGAKRVIPIHYNTFPPIEQDPQAFAAKVKNAEVFIPEIGEWYNAI